MFVTTVVFVV